MNSSKVYAKPKDPNPILKANFLSKWFFWYTRHIFKMGLRDDLKSEDIYEHLPKLDSARGSHVLIKYWEIELRRRKPSLMHMIFSVYGWKFVTISIFYSILETGLHAAQPLFLGGLVAYFSEGQTDISKKAAFLYAMGIVLCSFTLTLCFHPFMFYMFEMGIRIRIACAGLLYHKCLGASVTADNSGLSSFAIALLATDLPQLDEAFHYFHDLWCGPIEACIFGYIMYREIGWPAIVGIASIALFIPLQAWAAKFAAYFRRQSAEYGDDRVKVMNEIIAAIQVIKMYAWEKSFGKLIAMIRKKEIKSIRGTMNIYAALQCTNMISKLALFLTLVTYVYTGDIVTARQVFITSSYYDSLNESLLHFWPLSITTWVETIVCAKRITAFLLQTGEDHSLDDCMDYKQNAGNDGDTNKKPKNIKPRKSQVVHGLVHNPKAIKKGITFYNVSATWNKKEAEKRVMHLRDISFEVGESQFVGIVGDIGSCKSTLLNTILGEVEILHGNAEVHGKVSYAPQEPWLFEGSIRENILFVENYDEARYKAVLQVCQLERDLQLLPTSDATNVGERGISLSVGQRARIGLARAVYRKADIYIFDDPLAAVDTRVGRRLVDECFMKFLNGKIRLLVTHQLQHLHKTDHVLVLQNDGSIALQGLYDDDMREVLRSRMHLGDDAIFPKLSIHHVDSGVEDENASDAFKTKLSDIHKARKEQQHQGSVKFKTYLQYFQTLGVPLVVVLVFLLFVIARVSQALMDIFVSKWATWEESLPWTEESEWSYVEKRKSFVVNYTILIVATLIFYILRSYGFFHMCLHISLRLHDKLFKGIIRAYMSFFTLNSSGRILNRFSSDMLNIDVTLPQAILESMNFFCDALAVIAVVAVTNYWLLIPALIAIVVLYICRRIYIKASRSLKRVESITRSPIYSHANQTFNGLTSIRAFNATRQLESEFHSYQNINTSALYLYVTANRAFAFWIDVVCGLYILIVTFSFLLFKRDFYSGDVGLAITQSMNLIIICQWGMRQTSEMENSMTSVERIIEYTDIPNEPALETDKNFALSTDWPCKGEIVFDNVSLRYSPDSECILNELTFAIRPMEKVGIIGRTGAGKSSIIQAIFRLAYNEGVIKIDGINVDMLGLHDLRSRISIIPQEPLLFTGTLRYNLDPFEERSDEEIWRALEDVKLKNYVGTLEGGLNFRLSDGGCNFSMGQRQLICLARAILKHNKILIMDEATANVDPKTDKLIQQTIHKIFDECTVLTIAHRLHTVMDNDRVLVLDAGSLVEMGHPFELLQNEKGHLYKLVEQTGSGTARLLTLLAEESFIKRIKSQERTESERDQDDGGED